MAIDLSDFTPAKPVGLVLADSSDLQLAENPQDNPQPSTLTWVGGGDNSVYDAGDWSPNGVPAAGDTLYLLNGTANMDGGNLNGATLTTGYTLTQISGAPASYDPTLNMSDNADLTMGVGSEFGVPEDSTVNVSGDDTLALTGGIPLEGEPGAMHLQINLASGAQLIGSGGTDYEQVTINGPGDLAPTNMSFAEGSLNIQSDMIGTGTVKMAILQGEIGGSVAPGVSITLQVATTLTIDHPDQFQGTITAPDPQSVGGSTLPNEQVNLQGLVADSYDLSNDLLTLYKGSTVVDTLNFNDGAASTFVGQGASGVVIGMNKSGLPSGVTALPLHNVTIGM